MAAKSTPRKNPTRQTTRSVQDELQELRTASLIHEALEGVLSGIAEVMRTLGYTVQGSDRSDNYNVARLRKAGIAVSIGHKAENLGDLARELIGDLTGNSGRDGSFWSEVFEEINRTHRPQEAKSNL
jgi:hypothetical protein